MTDSSTSTYLCLVTQNAQKLGRNGGRITFKMLCDPERQHLYLTIVENDGGGYFSREIALFDSIERCLPEDPTTPFGAKAFASAFQGKSANQPGFCAAVLRSLGLLGPVENKPYQHVVAGDWAGWKTSMFAREGEPYVPPSNAEVGASGSPALANSACRSEAPDEDAHNKDDSGEKGRGKNRRQGTGGSA